MCHTRLPLPSPDRHTHTHIHICAHTAGKKTSHNLSSISAEQFSLAEVKTPAGGQGGTYRKEKGGLYCRCQHQQHPEPLRRQRCCLSFSSLSVCSVPQRRDGIGQELAQGEKQARVVPIPATRTITRSTLLWKSEREESCWQCVFGRLSGI